VIPSTLLGLLVFAASIGPGYIYVRIEEQYRLRATRSALLEAAELLSIGGFTSILSLLFWVVVADRLHWIDLSTVLNGGTTYLADHPVRTISFLLVTLLTSYAVAYAAAKRIHRGKPKTIELGSVWHNVLKNPDSSHVVYGTAELREGRLVAGQILTFTLDEEKEERQIALGPPLKVKGPEPGSQWSPLDGARCVVLNGADILTLTVQYPRAQETTSP
jgi:Family of unknown function (DUF6338)